LVVSTSAIDCLERLACYVLSGTLNPTHSLTVTGVRTLNLYFQSFRVNIHRQFETMCCETTKITQNSAVISTQRCTETVWGWLNVGALWH